MSTATIILIVVLLLIGSLVLSAIAYARQQSMAKRKARVMFCKQQADELISSLSLLLSIDPDFELILLLQRQAISHLTQASELIPNDGNLAATLKKHKINLIQYEKQQRDNELTPFLLSDTELNQAQYSLTQLTKSLDLMSNQGLINREEVNRLKQHLRELRLSLDVNSHLEQANRYGRSKDVVMYQVHVKHAREALRKTSIEIANKDAKIDRLTNALKLAKESHEITAFHDKK